MTNEEKAKEILSCHKCPFRTGRPHTSDIPEDACAVCFDYKSVMAMAQWKDEQLEAEKQALIDKACEWLNNNMYEGTCEQMLSKKPSLIRDLREEFKQAR